MGVTAPFWGITDEIAQERALLITAGVAAGFADKALAVPPNTVWYPEASELVAAGVVTAVTDGPPPGAAVRRPAVGAATGRQPPRDGLR